MKVGSLCYSTDQGLGYLAKDFYDYGIVTDVLVVAHGKRPEHTEWFPGAKRISNLAYCGYVQDMEDLCRRVDVMLFFETPFRWDLLDYCRKNKIKTALMVMHECMPKNLVGFHEDGLPNPNLYLCPSLLDYNAFHPERVAVNAAESVFLPVPVNVPWRLRERAEVFVHNAGHGGLKGRNGTKELLEAWNLVETIQARLIVRFQDASVLKAACGDSRVTFVGPGTRPRETLYDEGDVFVFPEKFNGLSLPLQEARAAGMLVMATDRFPMNTWLPNEPLIAPDRYVRNSVSPRCTEFDEAIIEPKMIAATIDAWYGKDISTYSLSGKAWSEENSWAVLGPKYLKLLEDLCSTST